SYTVGNPADKPAEALVGVEDDTAAADDDPLEAGIRKRGHAPRLMLLAAGEHATEGAADDAEEEDDKHRAEDRRDQPRLRQGQAFARGLHSAKDGDRSHCGEMM